MWNCLPLETPPGTNVHPHIYPTESLLTKTPFVFVICRSIMNHVKASFLPQSAGSSLATLFNFVVRSKSVSCVGPQHDICCPTSSPLPFSHVTSHSQTLTLNSSAPRGSWATWSLWLDSPQALRIRFELHRVWVMCFNANRCSLTSAW